MTKKYSGYTSDMLIKMLEQKDQEIEALKDKLSELEDKVADAIKAVGVKASE